MVFLLALAAYAQDVTSGALPEINSQLLRPTVDGTTTLVTDDAARGRHLGFLVRPLFHYANDPLIYARESGAREILVKDVVQADVLAAFSFDRFRIGLDLPVYLWTTGAGVEGGQAGLGDIAIDGKVVIFEQDRGSPLGVAFNPRLNIPSATVTTALGAKNAGWELAAIVDRRFGKLLLATNLGIRGGPKTSLENIVLNDFLVYRAAGSYAFHPKAGASLELFGNVPLSNEAANAAGTPLEWLVGGYAQPVGSLMVRAAAGTGITPGIGSPDFRVLLGVGYEPPREPPKPPDLDGDGLVDAEDTCPDRAEDTDGDRDTDGCPDIEPSVVVKAVDPKGQPVPAAAIQFAQNGKTWSGGPEGKFTLPPGDFAGEATAKGYRPGPVKFQIVETDEGRVIEVVLEPIPVGTLKVEIVDTAGKPIAGATAKAGPHNLSEGSWSIQGEPADFKVLAEAYGYKPAQQSGAIVADKETVLRFVLEPAQASLKGDRIDLRDTVYFDTAKAVIQSRSFALLDEVVVILGAHPELTRIRIEGHTDSRGSDAYNKDLSQRRASAIRDYLVSKGVVAERLEAIGYGEEKPIEKAETPAAWEKNRRVEFFVAARSD